MKLGKHLRGRRHKWKWSLNGRAKCPVCKARWRRKYGIGPKGGEMWVITMPDAEPIVIKRDMKLIPPCPGIQSTEADVKRAAEEALRIRAMKEAAGQECCLIVVGYASGREPFTLHGRVSADTGFEAMPDPPLTDHEMQPVAHAAKMAFAKVLWARKRQLC